MTDLLSSFISGEEAEIFIRKIYRLMGVLLVCSVLYSCIDVLEWYKFVDNSPSVSRLPHPLYRYKIWPIIGVLEALISLTVNLLAYRAWGYLDAYAGSADETLLHTALSRFYTITVITLCWFIIAICNAAFRTFLL